MPTIENKPRHRAFLRGMGICAMLSLLSCGPLVRPWYNRDVGGYVQPDPSATPTPEVPKALEETDADRLRRTAESYLGVPYSFGGQSRSGMDCSGFIRQVFSEVYGLDLPHNSSRMFRKGTPVTRAHLKPGDLVFFKNLGFIDHGGIYMGDNYFIHSSSSVGVGYSALNAPYFGEHYAGARRLIASPDDPP
ncbi:MAG: glycoside hydrolase [Fibrobacteres bacterium]|nr:glycoside hydrolase [Fibrobacterota bacterium]